MYREGGSTLRSFSFFRSPDKKGASFERRGAHYVQSVDSYLKDLGRETLFSKEEEKRNGALLFLCKKHLQRLGRSNVNRIKAKRNAYERYKEEIVDRFARANLRLVFRIAQRYKSNTYSLDDRIQDGNRGLLRAIEKFDWRKGYKFSTYASWWIAQKISRAGRDERLFRIPAYLLEKEHHVTRKRAELQSRLGRFPLASEIADELDQVSEKQVKALFSPVVSLPVMSLYEDFFSEKNPNETTKYIDVIPSGDPTPEEIQSFEELKDLLMEALTMLSERESDILRRRFGIGYSDYWTLDRIGAVYGLTRERIRQIADQALKKIRERYGNVLKAFLYAS